MAPLPPPAGRTPARGSRDVPIDHAAIPDLDPAPADGEAPVWIRIVGFVPGQRPTDEAFHPSLGSSDQAALILGEPTPHNRAYVLYEISVADTADLQLDVTLTFAGADGSPAREPISGWDRRVVPALVFEVGGDGVPRLTEARPGMSAQERRVLALSPERDLGAGDDPFGFDELFSRQVSVELRLTRGGERVAMARGSLLACDLRRTGSLYERLIERLVAPDTAHQADAAGLADPGVRFHPWYPVLLIGGDKAALYERALIGDIAHKRHNLSDPGWLLRVGLYLEFLTCLGIVEALKDDVGGLLTPAEREAFEHGERFAEIRKRIDPARWREVWELREIAFVRRGALRPASVSPRNLLCKQRATLAFLEAHHEDLKHAIELAGSNHHDAQETWQRVFRDAERAVLRSTSAAFPELGLLSEPLREFVLWHRRGTFGGQRALRVPGQVSGLLGDQDGLFASACSQYRRSMNAVAAWSRERLLMDYTGDECVPREVSLLETRLARPEQVELLQRRDGYQARLDIIDALPETGLPSIDEVERLISAAPVLAPFTDQERRELARTARLVTLGPLERIIVQGQVGTSLFVIVDGVVEVLVRGADGEDRAVGEMETGAVIGEMQLLSGKARSATVRAITTATVCEIAPRFYGPLLDSRPQLHDELAAIAAQRLREREQMLADMSLAADRARSVWARWIRPAREH
ncbi:MAG: cyclic nucleotide-binding domain-containing protein [Solirubrobacterales bacterium]|nr:cyclic nucleotide-binding domain-containing protein [Solirubrobacterales bacterium]